MIDTKELREQCANEKWLFGVETVLAMIDRLDELERENSVLAAGACPEGDAGLVGDEHGHFACQMKRKLDELEARAAVMREALLYAKPIVARWCHTQGPAEAFHQETIEPINEALSTDAGRKAVAVIEAARRVYAVDRVLYSHSGMDEAITGVSNAVEAFDGRH